MYTATHQQEAGRQSLGHVFVEALKREGVTAVFGNPGTTELPVMEALASAADAPAFYLGLQEIVCLGMADGYAQASGRPGVVNLHASPGLGNAMGNLYNAWRTRTPLVVTVGQQDTRFNLEAPLLHSDVVRQASQYSKWSWELRRPDELAAALRRAFKEASTPPTGPTFLSLPMDLMGEPSDAEPLAPIRIRPAGAPLELELAQAVAAIEAAQRPVIVAGDRLQSTGDRTSSTDDRSHPTAAGAAVVALADRIGAAAWAEPMAQRLPFPPDHPLFAGFLPPFGPLVKEVLGDADLVILLGSEAFLLYPPFEVGSPFPDGCKTIHVDDSPADIGIAHPPDVAIVADLALTANRLAEALPDSPDRRTKASETLAAARAKLERRGDEAVANAPTSSAAVARMLAEVCRGRPVVDEAVSMTGPLQRSWPSASPSERYGQRAGGLGWGLPAALGVALARPGQRTIAVLGDGSVMYAVQGLWTAARYGLGITFVVLDNGGYEIIRAGLRRQGGAAAKDARYLGTDLTGPAIGWEALAASMGLAYRSCDAAAEIPAAARELEAQDGPGLLRVAVSGDFTLP